MKSLVLLLTLFLFSTSAFGQANATNLQPGDMLTITKDANTPFQHLHFQRPNFIIKRGALANYKALDKMQVKIVALSEEGTVTLKPLNGKKFFRVFPYVKADLQKALEENELVLTGSEGR